MVYSDAPPYEILSTRLISFAEMQRMRRFARYWDLVGNSGNFVDSAPLLWRDCGSPFQGFMKWSDWLFEKTRRTHGIALIKLMKLLLEFLTTDAGVSGPEAATALLSDYRRTGHSDTPGFLSAGSHETDVIHLVPLTTAKRQQRHMTP